MIRDRSRICLPCLKMSSCNGSMVTCHAHTDLGNVHNTVSSLRCCVGSFLFNVLTACANWSNSAGLGSLEDRTAGWSKPR